MLGRVERAGYGFEAGELVSATVRRSCRHCAACDEGAPDSCLTGDYLERGITRLDGFARELAYEDPDQLIPIPHRLGRLGVLAEPASICARAVRHATTVGERQPWRLRRALVTGAGAIGLLATTLLRLSGVDVWTVSLEPTNAFVEEVGARYHRADNVDLHELGPFDLVVEAAGDAQLMAGALGLLDRNGVACILGIDGRERSVAIAGRAIGVDTVVQNRALFGSVNAHRRDWIAAVEALDLAAQRWPGALERLLALRVPLERFEEAFAFKGGKATLALAES
jgi:glucose 1-dehydrogenase